MKILLALAVTAAIVCAQETAPISPSEDTPGDAIIRAPGQSIVVTGMSQPAPLEEAHRDVSVLPLPARQRLLFSSWFNLLQLDAALDLQQRAPGGFLADLSIRGATFGQTLVLLNGLRVSDSQTGHFNLDLPVPLEAISSVEILKGSGSTLYGSDAIGGVVNVRTEPRETPDLRILTAFGNFGTNQQHIIGSFGGPNLTEELAVARDFTSGSSYDDDYRNLALSSITALKTSLGASILSFEYGDRPFGANQFYGNYPSWERTKTWFGSVQQDLGKNTEASVAYRRHTDLFVLFRYAPEIYTNRHIEDNWQGSLRRHDQLPHHAVLSYGGEGLSDSIESTNLGIHRRWRGSGYAFYDVRFARRFSVSAGIREEVYGSGEVATSPSISGAAWLNGRFKLRGSATRAYRLPSFTDLYYSDPANQGNPNLKPETATNYEGGLDAYLNTKVHASVTVFQRRDSNEIDYVRANSSAIWQATNFDKLHFTGVESSVEYAPVTGQTFSAGFMALRGVIATDGVLLSKYAFNYPVHSAVLEWRGSFAGRILARTRIGVVDRLTRDPYAVWDLSAGYSRGHVRPFLQLTNITNTVYQEIPAVAMPTRGILGGLEIVVAGSNR
jgi:iron complex outermembrane receptor protein